MTRNEGNTDRIIRIVLAVVIFAVALATEPWLAVIGLIPLATGVIGWCPLYTIFGFSTCPAENKA